MKPYFTAILFLCIFLLEVAAAKSFPLRQDAELSAICVADKEAAPIQLAVRDLQNDIEAVIGERPVLCATRSHDSRPRIVIGQLGSGGMIDALVAADRFDGAELEGAWESFLIEEIAPVAGEGGRVLVVAGSDLRGTIFGIYELSQAIGVSPWSWWADVPVRPDPGAAIPAGRQRFGPPSVKYRGIFINDEDWGLHPWAAHAFDPELGDIGPKTYEKVFELLLRLRANCLWPAMHKVSRPFNADGQNAALADAYGIVMSSSHAEPLLRNNVREWTAPHAHYNFNTHRDDVLKYWEERLETNGGYENIYSIGMRGIHDSGMQGGTSMADQVALLESIFAAQRNLLRQHANQNVEQVPQIFVAYKEVLKLYRAGLEVPSDVTIVWPDDNHGFIRDFASTEARANRKGGFGVYYHISYLGSPMAYLWLNSTPPALIWEEMVKAYALGADRFWMLNVGDIKPAEVGMDFFFELAWEVEKWGPSAQPEFLQAWAEHTFGADLAEDVAAIMAEYYRLNFTRKPEHLQFFMPLKEPRPCPWPEAEIAVRLKDFGNLVDAVDAVEARLAPSMRDAFFELVGYPVKGSAAANRRYFWTERFREGASVEAAREAWAGEHALQELTRVYNEDIAGGKWNRFIALEPADRDWRSMRIAPLALPPVPESLDGVREQHTPSNQDSHQAWEWVTAADDFSARSDVEDVGWRVVPGLGRSGKAVTILPFDAEGLKADTAPSLDYTVTVPETGSYTLTIELLPTFPLKAKAPLRLLVWTDDGATQGLELDREVKTPAWNEGVLAGFTPMEATLKLPAGRRTLRLIGPEPGVVVDRLVLRKAE